MTSAINGVDDVRRCRWAAGAWGVKDASPGGKVVSQFELIRPVVDRLAADEEQFSDLRDGAPFGELQ